MMNQAIELETAAPPAFLDLRAWAFRTRSSGAASAERQKLPLQSGPAEVGVLRFERGRGSEGPRSVDEFVHVIEGELRLETSRGVICVTAARDAMIPAGEVLSWRTQTPTRAIYMRYSGGAAPGEGHGLIDPSRPRRPSSAPAGDLMVGSSPECRSSTQYRSADGAFTCGIWESTAHARRATTYAHHELMHLLHGAVTLEDEHGRRAAFRAGDVVLVRRGARTSWSSSMSVTKTFAMWRPAAG